MRGKCLDEGILQGYLDGELSAAQTREAETHLAACDSCTAALREAESELSFFSTAFAPDPSVNVPTELLRSRIESAVAALPEARASEQRGATWNLKAWLAALVAPLAVAPQRAGAFAGLAAVVVFAVIFVSVQPLRPGGGAQDARRETAAVPTPSAEQTAQEPATTANNSEVAPVEIAAGETASRDRRLSKVRFSRAERTAVTPAGSVEASGATTETAQPEEAVAQKSVPGEDTYQQAIASLSRAVKATGDASLTPAMRADYERNLAVIDKAIEETRRAALRNPQDADASAFLFSAYQSKIDLLTAVADQTQSAALGR